MWDTIESDPGVFTALIEALGIKDVQVDEVWDLEGESLKRLQHQSKIYGIVFLFKYSSPSAELAKVESSGTVDYDLGQQIFFAQQVLQNACGTQAVLSIVLNQPDIEIGPALQEFKEFTAVLPCDVRGEVLSNSDLIRATHNSFARSDPFHSDETRVATEDDDVYHFISFAVINDMLLELDGLQPGPINHGPCTDDAFPDRVLSLLRDRISNRFSQGEIRFNILAVTKDPRTALRENPSEENKQLLEMEERKRRKWANENVLRRHNFVNMVYLVAKAAVEQSIREHGNIDGLLEEGKKNAQRKREIAENMRKMTSEPMDTS